MDNNGIPYFPLMCQMDDKMNLIEAEFGLKGFAVVVKLFQKIYGQQGYYCEWTKEVELLFSHNIGLGGDSVSEIVSAALKRGIFNQDIYDQYNVLTSHGIQINCFNGIRRRKKYSVKSEYLLVSATEIPNNVDIISGNVCKNRKNVNIFEQRKEKESKVKESKGEEIKVNSSPMRHKYGRYANVLLSDEDMDKLTHEFPNDYKERIERLSEYVASTGKKYKNHLATIRAWARNDSKKAQPGNDVPNVSFADIAKEMAGGQDDII